MALGIALAIASVIGIVYGILRKNKPLAIVSAIALVAIIVVWTYFYTHPY